MVCTIVYYYYLSAIYRPPPLFADTPVLGRLTRVWGALRYPEALVARATT